MRLGLWAAAAVALAGPAMAQNVERGKVLFGAECAACHSTIPGQNEIGPSLAGIYGMRSGMVKGYNFSNAMKSANIIWSAQTLNDFLKSPNSIVTGTNMPTVGREMHLGVPDVKDREDLIAYLRTLK